MACDSTIALLKLPEGSPSQLPGFYRLAASCMKEQMYVFRDAIAQAMFLIYCVAGCLCRWEAALLARSLLRR